MNCIGSGSLRAVLLAAAAPRLPVNTLCHIVRITSYHVARHSCGTRRARKPQHVTRHTLRITYDTSLVTCSSEQHHDALKGIRRERWRQVRVAADVPFRAIK